MSGPRRTRHSTAGVLAAVRAWVAGTDGRFVPLTARREIGKALDGEYDPYDPHDRATGDQVTRALEKMAAGRELIKVPHNSYGPDGKCNYSRQPDYYTPAAWAAAEAGAERQLAVRLAAADRWARVYDELASRDLHPVTGRGTDVRLSTASWFRLLGLDGD